MDFARAIAAKRDGQALSDADIQGIAAGIASGTMSDAQVGAFAMAVVLQGLTAKERLALTRAMQHTGQTLEWDLPGPVVDKHSTGGVGDTVSLVLAPALAACGLYVPMISGRGLGHTGGTLDKLEAIEGYTCLVEPDRFARIVKDVGCAIVGQSADLAPADRRLYAIRDVTGTVPSVDLICASILSKKLAAGLGTLVLDVKTGSGAFMSHKEDAGALARALVEVANAAGCKTSALITDMDEPLASAAGNALEVKSAVGMLTGTEVDARLWDVTVALGAEVLELAGVAGGADRIAQALQSGAAAERFGAMVAALGGPADFVDRSDAYLPVSPVIMEVEAQTEGFVSAIDGTALGEAVVDLGGGRRVAEDAIDPAVGLDWIAGRGLLVERDTVLARVHAATQEDAQAGARAVRAAYQIAETPPDDSPVILERIG